jgi:ribokinase
MAGPNFMHALRGVIRQTTTMSSNPAIITVIGSLNVDLVTRTPRVPVGGETLTSESFDIGWGGKGANQAVACARLSRTSKQAASGENSDVEVRMVGAVGDMTA